MHMSEGTAISACRVWTHKMADAMSQRIGARPRPTFSSRSEVMTKLARYNGYRS